ncbi:SigE family RNA polymerase sigma factor [Rugosimonospora africana]|uniref:DNA-directed RNA polymerase sigma-70 factor n=1 Tax=Rugosimonospora africana TaxID=556532 RepID=A0A8J3R3Q5_9ACTN|nr:SigE family RNA polymerase sigma factor [Rugosimonospora africana]GIH21173.1 DNA-directed RNA polymerase sigma-70 factor [Rugosimonospora africana]
MPDDELRDFVRVRYLDLLRMAYLLTGSWPGAEDLVQSVLVKVMGRWSRIDDPMAYLRRAMVNQQSSVWHRLRAEVLTARLPERPVAGDVSEEAAQRDELMRALATLPPRTRAVVVLRYWEDLSEAETAQILGCSVGAVKSQGSRGLAQLRTALRPRKTFVGGPSDGR